MVKPEDLIGAIAGYPAEIVELMIANQVAQGNPPRVEVFQIKADAPISVGGFSWGKSKEGPQYWSRVINAHKFELPNGTLPSKIEVKEEEVVEVPAVVADATVQTLKVGDTVIVDTLDTRAGSSIRKRIKKLIAMVDTPRGTMYLCVTESLLNKLLESEMNTSGVSSHLGGIALYKPEPQKVKLTLKDISEGKGVGVAPELIEIVL